MINDAHSFLSHICNNRWLIRVPSGKLICQIPDYFEMTQDNTKQSFVDLPNNISDQWWGRLARIGLANEINFRETGDRNTFKSTLGFFYPKIWVPAIRARETHISPIEIRTFCVCRSMQNHQILTAAGGCCKYCWKYIGKIDGQNYIVVSMNGDKKGSLVTKSRFLHNTKIASSKISEDETKNVKRKKKTPSCLVNCSYWNASSHATLCGGLHEFDLHCNIYSAYRITYWRCKSW